MIKEIKRLDVEEDFFTKIYTFPEELCDNIVEWFHQQVDEEQAVRVNRMQDSTDESSLIKRSVDVSISQQIAREVPVIHEYMEYLNKALENYAENFQNIFWGPRIGIKNNYNIQWYKPGDGYFKPHHERANSIQARDRVLVFMTYLNDVPGGGTYFEYQDKLYDAKKGHTLIWPADWTHMHVGQIVDKHKYIATGWIEYIELEDDVNLQQVGSLSVNDHSTENNYSFKEHSYEKL